ncbi:site-specific integrase [Alteromonas sp. ASW11-36]|uniref:Site-specific integrase n=1 Tax=Alteromonas arenosi TaxID=3055817 RepID=A0ABT7T104_9ALTE|nr:site-specific integrase [Alteromonas sp. ASW11-36]MDM7861904.1 site-specific integrase [Alteromonas sp. ASW11-36]
MKIERSQQIESAIKKMKSGEVKYKQQDFTVECHDLSRGMGSLLVQVSQTGNATFRYMQKVKGVRTYTVIGKYSKEGEGGIPLAKAREKALKYGKLAKKGINVKEHVAKKARRKKEKLKRKAMKQASGSFGQLIDFYVQSMKNDGKRTWSRVLNAIERDVFPSIPREQKAYLVTDEQIIHVLAEMINRGADTQSNRVRSYLHAAFNRGLKHDKDPANQHSKIVFGLKYNPVSHIPKQISAETVGERYLDRDELAYLLKLLSVNSGFSPVTANILKLCIFTGGQRPYELLTLKPSKIDFENNVIEVPEEYSKNKKSHLIPMTKTTRELVMWFYENCEAKGAEFLICNRTNLEEHYRTDSLSTAINRFCKSKKFRHFVPRDLRRTCKTHMGSLNISKELRDRIQNHAFTDVSSKHYDRWDYLTEKRVALEKWEKWLLGLLQT